MFVWTVLPLIALTLLELITDLIPFSTLLGTTSAGRALSSFPSITFGRSSLGVLWTSGLVLLSNSVAILPQAFSVNQVLHGLMEKTVRLFM